MNKASDENVVIDLAARRTNRGRTLMNVGDVLALKGSDVKMAKANETIGTVARRLRQAQVGVMVVSHDGASVDGIISERDIAYGLAERGGELHLLPVSIVMTRRVITCAPEDNLATAAALMNKHRIRHLPVVRNRRIVGIISSRDVLEHRISEMERKATLIGGIVASEFD